MPSMRMMVIIKGDPSVYYHAAHHVWSDGRFLHVDWYDIRGDGHSDTFAFPLNVDISPSIVEGA